MGDRTTKLCDYTNMPNAQFICKSIKSPEIVDSFEISRELLNLTTSIPRLKAYFF
jgi:hypothetical protein